MEKSPGDLAFDPSPLAVQYYFGDLSYSELPNICAQALEHGFDGRALRRLAGLVNPVARDSARMALTQPFVRWESTLQFRKTRHGLP